MTELILYIVRDHFVFFLLLLLLLSLILPNLLDTNHLESPPLRKSLAVVSSCHGSFLVVWLHELTKKSSWWKASEFAHVWSA